jgi:type I restriction-modification system DNA methylase subunit
LQFETNKQAMATDKQKSAAAEAFATKWSGTGYEKGDTQKFWLELLQKVLGVEDPYSFVEFEDKVMVDSTNFMDVYLPATRVLIEQKSIDKNLGAPIHQSDGALLNPFQQAKKYIVGLPLSRHPRWVVTCNFAEFWVYDMEQPNGEPQKILLKDLGKEYYRLQFLVDQKSEHISKEMQVSMQAGEIVGRIYDALLKQYDDASPEALRWLNILCVRIVFCLYAEDAGVFAHDQFHDYLVRYDAEDLRSALIRLFDTLNRPQNERSKYLKEDLKAFPYTNGGLFAEEIEIPKFTDELKKTLLDNASLDFDWSEISPTIFGAVFESTLNPETRRSGGMHYTSIENIHKVIDPLFLNDLRRELDEILDEKVEKVRKKKLDTYQDKISKLTFLDPACGSGNFLTETYLSLRRLENEAIVARYHGQSFLGFEEANPIKVSINQFYGIEINDFAVTVATTALWISEAQMLRETEKIVHHDIDFLPLKSYSNIREGNALIMNWATLSEPQKLNAIYTEQLNVYQTDSLGVSEPDIKYGTINKEIDVVAKDVVYKNIEDIIHEEQELVDYDFIMGNPPFVGYSLQSKQQKEDTLSVFVDHDGKPYKSAGKIDYVASWFFKAAQFVSGKRTRCAFVATNSITQGEQVAAVWKPLYERFGIHIDFAYRTFRWDSESDCKAHVHCVIVGFSHTNNNKPKNIYLGEKRFIQATNINAYLLDASDIWIRSRSHQLCNELPMTTGNRPADGGHLIIEKEDYEDFIKREPTAIPYIKKLIGSDEFINNKERYCLWLVGVTPAQLRSMPLVKQRVEACKLAREKSPDIGRQKLAFVPHLFRETYNPKSFIVIPKVSSEQRKYVPLGFMDDDTISTDLNFIIPDATLYHFGVLESNTHMAWMRTICGRLKSDYRYSKDIVYNNFPWPDENKKNFSSLRAKIEQTAQAILDARALFPDSSLADLYDETAMPIELRKAHQENDRAVLQAYGFDPKVYTDDKESFLVAELFKLYEKLSQQHEQEKTKG